MIQLTEVLLIPLVESCIWGLEFIDELNVIIHLLKVAHLKASRLEESKHALCRVERVSPVVIGHVLSVVFLHTQDPLTQTLHRKRKMEEKVN